MKYILDKEELVEAVAQYVTRKFAITEKRRADISFEIGRRDSEIVAIVEVK